MGKRTRKITEPQPTLRAWREHLGLSRQQVADLIDARWPNLAPTDQATIAKWESGETAVRVTDWRLLAEIYGTTPDRLLFDPSDNLTPELLQRAHHILVTKDRNALMAWLASAEFLPDASAD
jgi:transcriptional regulator with XRE-family HTH domain